MARSVLALAALLTACGARAPATPAKTATHAAPQPKTTDTEPRDAAISLDEIAARGATDAPLMRELARFDRFTARKAVRESGELHADKDLCVRAAFAASAPVRVWFEEPGGAKRGDPATGPNGMVPPQGPVCAKRGESLRLVVDGPPDLSAVRAVVFAAP